MVNQLIEFFKKTPTKAIQPDNAIAEKAAFNCRIMADNELEKAYFDMQEHLNNRYAHWDETEDGKLIKALGERLQQRSEVKTYDVIVRCVSHYSINAKTADDAEERARTLFHEGRQSDDSVISSVAVERR